MAEFFKRFPESTAKKLIGESLLQLQIINVLSDEISNHANKEQFADPVKRKEYLLDVSNDIVSKRYETVLRQLGGDGLLNDFLMKNLQDLRNTQKLQQDIQTSPLGRRNFT